MRKIIYVLAMLLISSGYYAQTVTTSFITQNCFFDNETPTLSVNIWAYNLDLQNPVESSATGVVINSIEDVVTVNGEEVYSTSSGSFSLNYTYNFAAESATSYYSVVVTRTIDYSDPHGDYTKQVTCSTSFNTVTVSSPRIFYSGNNLTGGILGICEGNYVTLSNTVNTGGSFTWSASGAEAIIGSTTSTSLNVLSNGAGSINLNWSKNSGGCSLSKTVSVTIKDKSVVDPASSSTKTYSFVPNELFVVSNVNGKGTLLKIKSSNGSGFNMLGLQVESGNYSNLTGSTYLMGSQNFNSSITALTYANGQTFIGFANGILLKINGTGGTGSNMFNVTENATGFVNGTSGTQYRLGDQLFQSAVNVVTYANSQTLVGLSNGKLLKVSGTGGTGSNMFNVTEIVGGFTTSSSAFTAYRLGDQVFLGAVNVVTYTNNQTLVGLSNGKLLKVSGTGGTGLNMFNVSESASGFTSNPAYTVYRLGDQVFSGSVTSVTVVGTQTFIGMANGRLLKITGTGGTGYDMLNVAETSDGFVSNPSYTAYRVGDQIFTSEVTSIINTGTQTLIGLANGGLLKVSGTGGTGTNMFNVTQGTSGFTSNSAYTTYRVGDQIFQSKVTGLMYDGTQTYIGLANGKLLKVTAAGGTGSNMFNVTEVAIGFQPGATGSSRIGDEVFVNVQCSGIDIVKLGKSMQIVGSETTDANSVREVITDLDQISAYPNPFTSEFTLSGLDQNEKYDIMIVDLTGKTILTKSLDGTNATVNLDDQLAGMYFVFIKNNEKTTKIKLVKQ